MGGGGEEWSHFVYSLCDFTWVVGVEISRTTHKLYIHIHILYIKKYFKLAAHTKSKPWST